MTFSIHQFMCPLCGKSTIPVARKSSQQRAKGHRKWLYCPWCKQQVNTYECRNEEDLIDFQAKFATGELTKTYQEEIQALPPQHRHM